MTDSEPEIKGTPITRGGGRFIRVGWRAVGYSVDDATEQRYRLYGLLLFVLAVAVGVATAYGVGFVFFHYVAPLASRVVPAINYYPEFIRLAIYLATLGLGGVIFWHIRAKIGERLVAGSTRLHDGFSLLEQRRRGCLQRKRQRIPMVLVIAAIAFVPLGLSQSLQAFLILVPLYFLLEGIVFQLWKPSR